MNAIIRPERPRAEDTHGHYDRLDDAEIERMRIQSAADALEAETMTPNCDVLTLANYLDELSDEDHRNLFLAILGESDAARTQVQNGLRELFFNEARIA